MTDSSTETHVVVVGGGLAGVACAKLLADDRRTRVTLLDRTGYHQFQPLLYQVATAELTGQDMSFDLSQLFEHEPSVTVRTAEVAAADADTATVTLADGETIAGDVLVLAAGAQPNFFRTPGAAEYSFPLYSLDDALRVRARMLQLFADVAAQPELADEGALTFVVVGAGPTGVETAGAAGRADPQRDAARVRQPAGGAGPGDPGRPRPHRPAGLLRPGARVRDQAAAQARRRAAPGRLRDRGRRRTTSGSATAPPCRPTWWCGAAARWPRRWPAPRTGSAPGRGGRVDVRPDLTVAGHRQRVRVGRLRQHRRSTRPIPTPSRCPSSAAWPSSPATGPPATSWPISTATAGATSSTTTRESWR